jgi:hypothetical protein
MLRIASNGVKRPSNGLKEQLIEDAGILECQRAESSWQGKDHVTIRYLKQVAFLGFEPSGLSLALALGAVPIAARIITDHLMTTMIALGFVPPKHCCATLPQRLQDPALRR